MGPNGDTSDYLGTKVHAVYIDELVPCDSEIGYCENIPWCDGLIFSFSIDISNRFHMSRKRFKKILMSHGINRNFAESLCQCIIFSKGKISYRDIYINSIFLNPNAGYFEVLREIYNRIKH